MTGKKPDPAPAPPAKPECWVGSDPATTSHIFDVHVQGEPALVITFCTRCGVIAKVQDP